MEDYRRLYAFLPYFEEIRYSREQSFFTEQEMTGTVYSAEMENFAESVYSSGFTDAEYAHTMHKYGVESEEDMKNRLAFADQALLKAIVTHMIRAERFISGAWITYEEKGMFVTALRRLGDLYGYSGSDGESPGE
ncbi:DUF6508 domain-containing protein [Indiicoccus explosivorum]|uniref:DUF6508 domain-containing protein n=1 Tax=Indiicoccus explosivorum TaxID=1917864 RepID=UPI000B438D7D|nr:DUF6508 domain-containing protein [Indiicoccus explosivorum]